jgi:long-chain fatty acid transport protein
LDGGYKSWGTGGITAGGAYRSDSEWVIVPNIAANWRVNWGLVDAIALTAYANGGVDTHYGSIANPNPCPLPGLTGVYCGGPLGIKYEQTFISAAFAKQVAPGISVGVAPILARQTVKVEGVSLFQNLSSDPANFSNRGTDDSWGYGVRGGIEWKVAPGVTLGVAGNTELQMSNFDRYRGLFAEQGGADIPATLQAGIAVDLRPDVTFLLDYKRIWYGSIATLANPGVLSPPFGTGPQFGADGGAGFGVRDTDVVKVGLEWRRAIPTIHSRSPRAMRTSTS